MLNTEEKLAQIRTRLEATFRPTQLLVQDDSAEHVGHANAGAGHFTVEITSDAFCGLPLLERHRLIYYALKDLMANEIHALRIVARATNESIKLN